MGKKLSRCFITFVQAFSLCTVPGSFFPFAIIIIKDFVDPFVKIRKFDGNK